MITHVISGLEPTRSPDIQAWFHSHGYRQQILRLRPPIGGARGLLAQPILNSMRSHKHPQNAGMGIWLTLVVVGALSALYLSRF